MISFCKVLHCSRYFTHYASIFNILHLYTSPSTAGTLATRQKYRLPVLYTVRYVNALHPVILKCTGTTGITGTDTIGCRRASMPAEAQATVYTSYTPSCSAHEPCWGSQLILSSPLLNF